MVHHLRGMYAFAIWDERKRGLLLARDPFGIKPLYYADDGTTIRVASQVKALLKSREIDTTPEPPERFSSAKATSWAERKRWAGCFSRQ